MVDSGAGGSGRSVAGDGVAGDGVGGEPLYFQFESDFVAAWRCIPMRVRLALDTCGVKLKLVHWSALSEGDRQVLVELPCGTEVEADRYREILLGMVALTDQGMPKSLPIPDCPAWEDGGVVPGDVLEKAVSCGVDVGVEVWGGLSRLQRFALIKLSRPGHENRNFLPALKEFGVI